MNEMRKYINIVEYAGNDRAIRYEDIDNWQNVPDEYKNRLNDRFESCHEMFDLISGGYADKIKAEYRTQYHSMWFNMYNTDAIFLMFLIYDFKQNEIFFENIRSKRSERTMVSARKLLRGLLQFCKKLNITKIHMNSMQDGSYQWARIGFYPVGSLEDYDYWKQFEQILLSKLEVSEMDIISRNKCEDIIMDNDGHEMIWKLSMEKGAEELLYDEDWDGVLDLENPKCLERLKRFVRI